MKNKGKKVDNTEYDRLYKVLNKEQKRAVDAIEGPVMVIAGPGTGKTTILTLRIANILKKTDTAPDSILALTFTESGAYAMRRKLADIIGPTAYKVNIHTFHGFALGIIEKYPDYFPRIIGSSLIAESEQVKIIEKLIDSKEINILRPFGDPRFYVKNILHEIHMLKRENISPDHFEDSIKKDMVMSKVGKPTEIEKNEKRNAKNLELANIYKNYEKQLAKQKYYDFDDMLLELIRVMEKEDMFKLILQESYQYILADEHQDANAAQNRILELLADFHDSPNLFIVGDDKQAIYRFQGASLDNFLYFSKKYRGAEVISLVHNYRSHQGILDASHNVISQNPTIPDRKLTKLVSLQIGRKPVYVNEFETEKEEMEYLATVIERVINKGEKAEEVAIIFRENRDAELVISSLESHGIPYRVESDQDIMSDPLVAKIIILSKAIHDLSNSEYLARALILPELGCDSACVSETLGNRGRISLHEFIKKGNPDKDFVIESNIRIAYNKLNKWAGMSATVPFLELIQIIIEETGMISSLIQSPDSLRKLNILESFLENINRAQSKKPFYLKDFIEYVSIIDEHGIKEKKTYIEHQNGVRLMTAHRSKGLEFNHVFIVKAIDGSWGNKIKRNLFNVPIIEHVRDNGRIEDERRLFYVAMTRARESVNISYAKSYGDKEVMPTQFIAEIDSKLVEFERPKAVTRQDAFKKKMTTLRPSSPVSILNPDFVRKLFLSHPFSVTHLNNYLRCPWNYFFVNLIRIPKTQEKSQMYGTAVHAALRSFFDSYKEERDMKKNELLELFRFHIDKQPMTESEREESLEKGRKSIGGYYDEYYPIWGRKLLTEYNIKGVDLDFDLAKEKHSIELTGKLDKIEFLGDHDAIVVDFKTGKPKSRNEMEGKTKDSNGDYKRQLTFYKLLLDGNGSKFKMRHGEIDFIEPNDRGFYKKEKFEITKDEVEALRELIRTTAKEITSLSFIGNTCKDKKCEYCRLGKILLEGYVSSTKKE